MNSERLITALGNFPSVLVPLVEGLTDEEVRIKPKSGAWSVLEIIRHLADEEVEDFRTRLRMTLEDPTRSWPGIDPEAAAEERRYNEADPDESVQLFLAERGKSLEWLRSLENPDWHRYRDHPLLGRLHAGGLLAAWAAHDMLHLRQIAKRRFELAGEYANPFSTTYAGEWRP